MRCERFKVCSFLSARRLDSMYKATQSNEPRERELHDVLNSISTVCIMLYPSAKFDVHIPSLFIAIGANFEGPLEKVEKASPLVVWMIVGVMVLTARLPSSFIKK